MCAGSKGIERLVILDTRYPTYCRKGCVLPWCPCHVQVVRGPQILAGTGYLPSFHFLLISYP